MTSPTDLPLSRELRAIIDDRANWLVDAVAMATQNRAFLRGEPECDEVACDAIQMNGAKAIEVAIRKTEAALAITLREERDEARREVEQCHAKATCMCGSYVGEHGMGDGTVPIREKEG